jgi:hypothetical protein
MPAFLPMLVLSSQLVLVAGAAPQLNVEPSCRAAADASVTLSANRDEGSCMRDEMTSRDTLNKDWGSFNAADQSHCQQLTSLGGGPSYVELLTCLELSKQAAALPSESRAGGKLKP